MTNIFDVAKVAGVSKSTVSRVFSGNGYVSVKTKSKVIKVADQLDYYPSILGRQLKRQRTKTIGLVAKSYYPEVGRILALTANYAQENGFKLEVSFTRNREDEIKVLQELKVHALDALFFIDNRNTWERIGFYAKYGPIVTSCRVNGHNIFSSYIDHYPLYFEILKYIKSTYGNVSVGHILNDPHENNTMACVHAISDFRTYNPNCADWVTFFSEQINTGEQVGKKFLNLQNPPDVIIVYSDYIAAGFISYLRKNNILVPEDVKVFGFNNNKWSKYMEISTIDSCLPIQVKNDVNKIISKLENKKFVPLTISPKMIVRKTC